MRACRGGGATIISSRLKQGGFLARRATSSDGSATQTVIAPRGGWSLPDFAELYRYRDLLKFFVLRDIRVRYRQTLLGAAWVLLQPLLTMAILAVVFGRLIGIETGGIPYPLFALAGLVLWMYFAQALTAASTSFIKDTGLVEKVYFPRLVMPLSATISGLVDLAIGAAMLIALLPIFGIWPGPRALLCIPIALLVVLLAAGLGAMVAALAVRFRDINYLVPFALQLGLFATPIAYPLSLVPERWQPLMGLNPMAGFVAAFRWSLMDTQANPWPAFAVSAATTCALLLAGLLVFRRLERSFADVI